MSSFVYTDRERFREIAATAPAGARVPVELRVDVEDPFDAYRRARDGPGGVFYETTGGQAGWGHFAVDPESRLTVSADAVVADRQVATADSPTGDYRRETPTLSALDGLLADETLVRGECDVPYPCGVFGWLSYDAARELEDFPPEAPEGPGAVDDRALPRLQVAAFDRVASWECPVSDTDDDPVTLRVTVCPPIPEENEESAALDACYDDAVARGEALVERIREGDPATGPAPAPGDTATFESDVGAEAYADAVRAVKQYVHDGDTFQANVSQRLRAPAAVHSVAAYDALRDVNPAPYSGLVEFGDLPGGGPDLVSASPELLLERVPEGGDADGGPDANAGARLVTEPIAGTRPRGETAEADAALEAELTGDEKERAEHAMLVDLERNDLGKVSQFGTVDVSEYRRVDRYSEVMHLVSVVEGRARPDVSLSEAVAACFPGGTITGAPKPRTMEIIDELEPTRRGPYTGSMLAAGYDGRATLNIVIRTLVRHADEYHLRVGAGIVHDSDPEAEYEETLAKGRALVNAIDEALEAGEMAVEEAGSGAVGGGVDDD